MEMFFVNLYYFLYHNVTLKDFQTDTGIIEPIQVLLDCVNCDVIYGCV